MTRYLVTDQLPDVADLLRGGHVVLLSRDPLACVGLRRLGLEVRDTLLVLEPGGSRFAFLCRKPVEQTVAENVLRYGTGGLWIDGCRVSASDVFGGGATMSSSGHTLGKFNRTHTPGDLKPGSPLGRWPSNLVLIHGPECRRSGHHTVQSRAPVLNRKRGAGYHVDNKVFGAGTGEFSSVGYGDENGLETVAAWTCQDGCPVATLDQQSGNLPTQKSRSNPDAPNTQGLGLFGQATKQKNGPEYFGGFGGASRFFPQFASPAGFEAWLARLLGGPEDNQ